MTLEPATASDTIRATSILASPSTTLSTATAVAGQSARRRCASASMNDTASNGLQKKITERSASGTSHHVFLPIRAHPTSMSSPTARSRTVGSSGIGAHGAGPSSLGAVVTLPQAVS